MTAPLDTQLREYTHYFDSLLEEIAVEDVLTERVTEGVVRPLRPRPSVPRRGWWVAAGAAALVALIIGLVGLFASTDTEPAPPATDPVPTLEDVPPQLRGSGTLGSELGEIRWSYYTGPSGPGSSLFELPDGELAMWLTGEELLWTSADGVAWESAHLPVPVDAESLTAGVVGDEYWLRTSNPTTLWRSKDFTSWEQVDLSTLALPERFNMDWAVGIDFVVESDSGVLVSWTASPILPLDDWYPALAETHRDLHIDTIGHDPGAAYPVRGTRRSDGTDETVALMRLERFGENGSAWQAYDAEGGWEIAYFAFGAGESLVDDPLTYSIEGLLLIDSGGDVEALSPPWSTQEGRLMGLVAAGDRLFAAFGHGDVATFNLWESGDGRSWNLAGVAPGTGAVGLEASDAIAYALFEGEETSALWLLREGSDWVRAPVPSGGSADAVRALGDGYAGWAAGSLWLSRDGSEWSPVDLASLGVGTDSAVPVVEPPGRVGIERLVLRFGPRDQPGGEEPGAQFVVLEVQP